jgi:RNA polymerase sigma-70 factor (ECF subfamily)
MNSTATSKWMAAQRNEAVAEIEDFDATVRLHWTRVYRFVLSSIGDQEAAETITQDCFWKAYRGRQQFRGDCSVRTWLMRIAINLVRDTTRSRRFQFWRRAAATSVDVHAMAGWIAADHLTPEDRALIHERVEKVWEAAKALSTKQRTVFLLRFVEEMDLLEIAETTGLTESAVKVHLFRAVHAVRKRLG